MKQKLFTITLLLILMTQFVAATNNTSSISPKNFTINQQNPINVFLSQEINSPQLRFIGSPTSIIFSELLIYVIIIITLMRIIYDILDLGGIIDKKIINFGIAIIITLIGTQQGIVYKMMQPILNLTTIAGKTSLMRVGTIILIIIAIFVILIILKKLFKEMKESAKDAKADEKAGKLKTLSKVQDIQMAGAGMKKPSS